MDTQNNTQTNRQILAGEVYEETTEGQRPQVLTPLSIATPPQEQKKETETDEQQVERVKASEQRYYLTPKYKEWVRLFLDRSNKETFGNATRAALLAYGLDPEKDYWTAATIGKENYKKHQNLTKLLLDKKGFTYSAFVDILVKKAINNKSNELLEYLRQIGEFYDLPEIPSATGVQAGNTTNYNTQINGINLEQLDDGQLRQYTESLRARLINTTSTGAPGTGEKDPGQPA